MQVAPHLMARPGELRMARWPEFDFKEAVWKIPAERMKMRRPHMVPLSQQVLAYLEELRLLTGPDGYVFPAFHTWKRPLSENTINQTFRRMGYGVGEVTPHRRHSGPESAAIWPIPTTPARAQKSTLKSGPPPAQQGGPRRMDTEGLDYLEDLLDERLSEFMKAI